MDGVFTGVRMAAVLAATPSAEPPEATLRGADGKEVTLSRWRGKPVILIYEDRHSTTVNSALKEALFERGRALGLLEAAWVVAVANLEGFDFFPARPLALAHVRAVRGARSIGLRRPPLRWVMKPP